LYRLAAGAISVDGSVVVDFYLASEIALLEELFRGRLLMSDFVELELLEADIRLAAAQTAAFSLTEEWNFFADLRRRKPGLGLGELGALTVARFHNAILVTNDRQARSAVEEFEIPVHGGLGVLEYATEASHRSGAEAVRILEEMIRQGAWISAELAETFRNKAFDAD